jgi:NAD-dependent dihydropyrimidine dehydrogenase PreA subunit
MKINFEMCIGCENCIPYCPMGAIEVKDEVVFINSDECVECGVCLSSANCPVEAIYQDELEWPRVIRSQFSNPKKPHKSSTKRHGRGTEEMKTNDVTGRFKRGEIGLGIELGRPGVGVRLREFEKFTVAYTKLGLELEKANSAYALIQDPSTGKLPPEILDEKLMSIIVEVKFGPERLQEVLEETKKLAKDLDTVFSISIISKVEDNGFVPILDMVKEAGFKPSVNCKTNVGLGRPLAEEV